MRTRMTARILPLPAASSLLPNRCLSRAVNDASGSLRSRSEPGPPPGYGHHAEASTPAPKIPGTSPIPKTDANDPSSIRSFIIQVGALATDRSISDK